MNLDCLENIKDRINNCYRAISICQSMIIDIKDWFPDLTKKWTSVIRANERAIIRYKRAFNQELENIKYKGE